MRKKSDMLSSLISQVFVLIAIVAQTSLSQQVTLSSGSITGITDPSTGAISFLGIQYGRAQRWASPTPITSYEPSSFQATQVSKYGCAQNCLSGGSACPQKVAEDCLFLNIWTPFTSMAQLNNTANSLPVLVFIYGGTFTEGASNLPMYDGAALSIELNAVVVTFDYRVSILGFPGVLPTSNVGVNLGIQDQRLAIQWIQQNAGSFGGNSSRMTLMGHSAGAISAVVHLSHPSTKGIFDNAILMSPPALPFKPRAEAQIDMLRIAASLNCSTFPGSLNASVWSCLNGYSSRDILNAYDDTVKKFRARGSSPIMSYLLPIVDGIDVLEHPFVTLSKTTAPLATSIIMGNVVNESSYLADQLFKGNVSQVLLDVFSDYTFESYSSQILSMYPQIPDGSLEDRKPVLSSIMTDRLFICPVQKILGTKNLTRSGLIYRYMWGAPWQGRSDDTTGKFCPDDTVCHVVDVLHLFLNETSTESRQTTKAFRAYISQFIHTGNPSQPNPQLPVWVAYGSNATYTPWLLFQTPTSQSLNAVRPITAKGPSSQVCEKMNTFVSPTQSSKAVLANTSVTDLSSIFVGKAVYYPFWAFFIFVLLAQAFVILFVQYKTSRVLNFLKQVHEVLPHRSSWSSFQPETTTDDETATTEKKLDPESALQSTTGPDTNASRLVTFIPKPMEVRARYLSYSVKDKKENKYLLKDISFKCYPGTLTAIMGPSGCGKTSLLSIISRQLGDEESFQAVFYNRRPLSKYPPKKFHTLVGFVPQHDPPFHGLTPRQVLTYNAMLQLPKGTPSMEAAKRAAFVLDTLSLNSCADVVIEKPGSGKPSISGGQMRRVAIAVALLQQPSVLILDEPTSGLDASSSLDVIHVLSRLATKGYTVIVSIHQPRLDIFHSFNNILLLTKGQKLFFGPPSHCAEYVKKLGEHIASNTANQRYKKTMLRVIKEVTNPADMILDVAGIIEDNDLDTAIKSDGAHVPMLNMTPFSAVTETTNTPASTVFNEPNAISTPFLGLRIDTEAVVLKATPLSLEDVTNPAHGDSTRRLVTIPQINTHASHQMTRYEARMVNALKSSDSQLLGKSPSGLINILVLDSQASIGPEADDIGVIGQAMIINARWWSQKPLLRKLMMLFIAVFAIGIAGLLMRRPGGDLISLTLMLKGVAILSIGFGALKNINVSFDFYEDLDSWKFDQQSGRVSPAAFFLHRLIYETSMGTLEALIAGTIAYFCMDVPIDGDRYQSFMVIYVMFYNAFIAAYTLIYSTRLGRAEARSISFLAQAVFAITCGLWVRNGDTLVYGWFFWLQYLNPVYYAMSSLMKVVLSGVGSCVLVDENYQCVTYIGDAMLKQARVNDIDPNMGVLLLFALWTSFRLIQLCLFLRDVYGKHVKRLVRDIFDRKEEINVLSP